jgi:uncharacterized protein (DUF1015 family)
VEIEKVVTQPYDMITPQMQKEYYERSPYNYVRVVLGKKKDRYAEALEALNRWIGEKVMIQDDKPAIYPYWQEFLYGGEARVRKGWIAVFNLGDRVLKHEKTLSKPKEDRFRLLMTTKKNLEQIFLLHDSSYCPEPASEPIAEARDEYGVTHKLWRMDDESAIEELRGEMEDQMPIIADGHHRYEVSLEVQKLCRDGDKPCNYRMATFVSAHDPGLVILPTYRLVYGCKMGSDELLARAKEHFEVEKGRKVLERHEIGLYDGKDDYVLRLKEEESDKLLDVVILHDLLLKDVFGDMEEQISYARQEEEGRKSVGKGYQYLFTLCPISIEEVIEIAGRGETMPQKSTDFYPKMLSGLTAFDLERW